MSPRKIFLLATSIVPIVGAACGGGVDVAVAPQDAAPAADAGARSEASKVDVGSKPEDAGSWGGYCTDEIDATTFPWKPPRVLPGSCANDDLEAFVAFVEKTDDPQKWKDGPWTTNDACRACVFAKETETWSPLILNATGQLAELNVGGCIAVASGIEACGKSYHQWRTCYLEACSDANCGLGDFTKCVAAANKGACKKAFDAIIPSCGSAQVAADAETACDGEKYVFEGPIRAQCIGLGDGDL